MKKSRAQGTRDKRGFTLVEMIVSVGLFAIVMLVSTVTLLALVSANRKAQALQSVMSNLNIALDGMVRAIRMGTDYDGSSGCSGNSGDPNDCTGGSTTFTFKPFCESSCDPLERWTYIFDPSGVSCEEGRLCKSENGTDFRAITAPSVRIESLTFYVIGTMPGDTTQPKAVISVKGTAGVSGTKTETTFAIQATAVQRILDL